MCKICLVSEHKNYATLKQKNNRLLMELTIATKSPPEPVRDLLVLDRNIFLKKLAAYGITPLNQYDPLDDTITLASVAELERIAPDLCYPAGWYIDQIWDCENYAAQAENDAARLFHVSGICRVLGHMPLGYHGFTVTLDKDNFELWVLEPNAGFDYSGGWCRPEEIDYKPEKILV